MELALLACLLSPRSNELHGVFLLLTGHVHSSTHETLAKTISLLEDIDLFAF